ncbi:MAG: type II toxin-antitoxin system death-on-curing family toxin [Solirubrobacteraceae bacterium]
MIFLRLDDLVHIATRVLGAEPAVRDYGLLESAAARPQASAFGEDAYATIHEKAAALLHSLARNHALLDGTKRLALAATIAYYGMNGMRLTFSNDEAHALVIAVAGGKLDDVVGIAAALARHTATTDAC